MRYILAHDTARRLAIECVRAAPDGYVVRVDEPTRNLEQNARLWAMLHEVSQQVVWYGTKLTEDEWKDVFTAALKKSKVVPGLDGGFVVCGQRTSTMTKREFSDLIEVIQAFAAEHDVKFAEQVAA